MRWLTLIVDDEPLARRNLEVLLSDERDLELLPSVADADTALATMRARTVDLLFLDIRMPGRSGIDLLRDLYAEDLPRVPFVVLVTAFDSYAVEAFDLDARDYLVKPFSEERLQVTLTRARNQLAMARAQDPGTVLRAAVASEPEAGRLVLETDDGLELIEPAELVWVEAADHYLILHTTRGKPIVRKTLRELDASLPGFVRIHRARLVNPAYVVRCRKLPLRGAVVELRDGTVLEVSRRRWAEVRAAMASALSSG